MANVFAPKSASDDSILLCRTRIAVMTTMIEKTPTSTPRRVNAERNLCVATALSAIRQLSFTSMRHISFAAQRVHGIHARRTPGREEAGDDARDQRHGD